MWCKPKRNLIFSVYRTARGGWRIRIALQNECSFAKIILPKIKAKELSCLPFLGRGLSYWMARGTRKPPRRVQKGRQGKNKQVSTVFLIKFPNRIGWSSARSARSTGESQNNHLPDIEGQEGKAIQWKLAYVKSVMESQKWSLGQIFMARPPVGRQVDREARCVSHYGSGALLLTSGKRKEFITNVWHHIWTQFIAISGDQHIQV